MQGAQVALRCQCRLGDLYIEDEVGAAKVLEAYRRSGAAFLSDLRGPFALAIVLPEEKKVLIAIDRMGIERLTWGRQGDTLAVGT